MKSNIKYFKKFEELPVDEFYQNVLYDKKFGYYNSRYPFGEKGDFITAPHISNLFSEIIAIWMVSTWQTFGKPKKLNIIELGPGDGSLIKILIEVFRRFPDFDKAKKIYLLEVSDTLKKIQKKNIKNKNIKWIKNLNEVRKSPTIFFGNEFFDAIPIKQFKRNKNKLLEKRLVLKKNYKIDWIYKNANREDKKLIDSFKTLKKLKFIEFPKFGLAELKKIIKLISKFQGCFLMIDYGYVNPFNKDTLQSVIRHKKNNILENLGKADITSHVNFALIKEFFQRNNFKVKNTISQREFLKKMGIINRANILSEKMSFKEKSSLYLRLKRLIDPNLMGDLFKVFLAYNHSNKKYFGFD